MMNAPKEKKKLMFAFFAAIIITASSFIIIYNYETSYANSSKGLLVDINVSLSGIPTDASTYLSNYTESGFNYNLSNASVTLLSANPDWILTGGNLGHKNITYNLSSNPYIQDVFNGRSNSKGIVNGYVNNTIQQIAKSWRNVIQSGGYNVTVTEEATYSYIRNGTLYGFNYFNNIEYSPFNPMFNSLSSYKFYNGISPLIFKSTLHFNLSKPDFVKKINVSNVLNTLKEKNFRQIGGGGGNTGNTNPCTPSVVDKNIKINTWTGILPLLYSSMRLPSNSLFSMFSTYASANMTLKFNSAQHTQGEYGTFQSTTSSYSATLPYSPPVAVDSNSQTNNMSINYITNVSFEALEFKPYYISTYWYNGGTSYYCVATPGANETNIQIVGAKNPQVKLNHPYNLANNGNASETSNYWSATLNMLGISSVKAYQLNAGDVYSSFNLSYYANESNNANDYLQSAEKGVGVFSAALGVALAINAVTGIIPIASSVEDAMNAVTLTFAEVGLLTTLASDFTSISVVVAEKINLNIFEIGNQPYSYTTGSNFQIYVYQSPQTVQFYGNGGNLYSYQPFVSVVNVIPT